MRVMAFLILCISFFSWSCNPCTSTDTIEIPNEVRDYFGVFKPGNYWVYQTNSLKYDSMYVSYYKDSIVGPGNAFCYKLKTMNIKMKMKSNFLQKAYLYTHGIDDIFIYGLAFDIDAFAFSYFNSKRTPKELKDTMLSQDKNFYLKKNVGIIAYKIGNDSFYLVRKKIM